MTATPELTHELIEDIPAAPGWPISRPNRATDRPTTERLLKEFKRVILTFIVLGPDIPLHLTPLSNQSTVSTAVQCD